MLELEACQPYLSGEPSPRWSTELVFLRSLGQISISSEVTSLQQDAPHSQVPSDPCGWTFISWVRRFFHFIFSATAPTTSQPLCPLKRIRGPTEP